MKEHAQQTSATTAQHVQQSTQQITAPSELDLPQSGSEDDDETWLTEPTGRKTTTTIKVAAEATNYAEATQIVGNPFHHRSKAQPVAEPDLLRTTTVTRGCNLPGPWSQDDDEDSSPIVPECDQAEHPRCSHYHYTLTQSGFLMATLVVGTDSKERVTTGNTKNTHKVTPASLPNQLMSHNKNAHLTLQIL